MVSAVKRMLLTIYLLIHTPIFMLYLTVGALRNFVKSQLADPEMSFYLCKFRFMFYNFLMSVLQAYCHHLGLLILIATASEL